MRAWMLLLAASAAASAADTEGALIFQKHIKPVLVAKCQGCHGKQQMSGLNVSTREGLAKGGHRGPAFAILVAALEHQGALKMPPGEKLPTETIAAFKRWIDLGAPWSDAPTASSHAAADPSDLWAFQPLKHYDPPRRASNAIDAFILDKLAAKNLKQAPRADRRTLIRRATFDLTGLPPTPDEVAAFLKDPSPDQQAFTKIIERLLASTHYGERWGRHWLDVVRYADTGGYSNDFERPNAWRYREYVIRSFNQDKPYNQFVREQIAGDEIDPANPENLIATGFLRMGPWEHTGMSVAAETRQAWLDDVTHTTSATFLGLTMECARCHDHKFDPLPTKDYYRMQAIFATTEFAERPAAFLAGESKGNFAAGRELMQEMIRRNEAGIADFLNQTRQRMAAKRGVAPETLTKQEVMQAFNKKEFMSGEEFERYKVYQKRKELYERSTKRFEAIAYSVSDKKQKELPETFILPVGNLKTPGEKVTPGVLNALYSIGKQPLPEIPATAVSRRRQLAEWIANDRNPLTPRVMANRIWQYHFGRGIAANSNNLGKMGKRPTHPELLDFLAEYFIQHGWSVKAMHRLMMLSDAYQMASSPGDPDQLAKADPENDLLSFFRSRRLESEEIRDTILSVSGELSPDTGGPGTFPEINEDVANQPQQIMGTLMPAYKASKLKRDRNRRTIYTYQKRNLVDPLLEVLNGASLDSSTEQRIATTVPTQVFALFNSKAMHDSALAFAARVASSAQSRDEQIKAAYRLTYHREPTASEWPLLRAHVDKMTVYHRQHPSVDMPRKPVVRSITSELTGTEVPIEEEQEPGTYEENLKASALPPETRALADLALVLFNSDEFLYVR